MDYSGVLSNTSRKRRRVKARAGAVKIPALEGDAGCVPNRTRAVTHFDRCATSDMGPRTETAGRFSVEITGSHDVS